MNYSLEQLREWAAMLEREDAEDYQDSIKQLRAHADALEKLKAAHELADLMDDVLLSYHEATRNEWSAKAHKAIAAIREKP